MQLHFEVYGQGKPLIILHGLLGSSSNWHSVSLKLASYLKVFVLDQRNHGRSPHSFEMSYPIMAQDVRDFLEAHGFSEAFILGHSMGGKTAMQLALLFPEAVSKLVVADIGPVKYAPRHEKMLAGMASLDLGRFQSRQEIEAALAPAVPDLSTRRFFLKNLEREASGRFRWRIGLQEIIKNYPALTEAVTFSRSFEKPALFIRGETSDYFNESHLASVQKLFPRARFQTIPGAGHLLHAEQPEQFVHVVQEFLLNTK